jgi:hypothetical protein
MLDFLHRSGLTARSAFKQVDEDSKELLRQAESRRPDRDGEVALANAIGAAEGAVREMNMQGIMVRSTYTNREWDGLNDVPSP